MFDAFSRSWAITKLSLDVIRKDKELLFFPILAGFFSFLFIIAILFPSVITILIAGSVPKLTGIITLLLFVVYFGLAFIATFFSVCVVYTTKKRFEGGNASFGESISFAFKKVHLIFYWSLVSASVGLILRFIENMAKNNKGVGALLLRWVYYLLGALWSVVTVFVIPAMVYHNLTPFAAIKRTVESLKTTWGESLIRYYGVGLVQFVFMVVGIAVFVILGLISSVLGIFGIIPVIFLAVIYFVGVIVFFSLINSIFNTALYAYANGCKLPKEYRKDVMQKAFMSRK